MAAFAYGALEAAPGRLPELVAALRAVTDPERVAVFGAQIGWLSTEVRVLRHGDGPAVDPALVSRLEQDGVLRTGSARLERLESTVRPVGRLVLPADGVYAHRWFELRPEADVAEFTDLSLAAWEAGFETLYDAAPMGLFAGPDEDGVRRLLLVTRYGSLADWTESRPTPAARDGQHGEVDRLLRARQPMVARSWVCSSVIVG